jgi:sigma-E factor negative regulatory protein RseA
MTNQNERVSSMLDGELGDAEMDLVLASFKTPAGKHLQAEWDIYHEIGDVLRSEELDASLSKNFSTRFSARLEQEPVLLAPKRSNEEKPESVQAVLANVHTIRSTATARYVAITSIAAMVMVAFIMAPQVIPLLNGANNSTTQLTRSEVTDAATPASIKLATNSSSANFTATKDLEFAPKLENQVEMLRDPRLDSYLLAHQRVAPTLDNGARYIKPANVVAKGEVEK